jgi:hypothetical protein
VTPEQADAIRNHVRTWTPLTREDIHRVASIITSLSEATR